MTGLEIAAATYLFAWARQRGKKVADRAGTEADGAFGLAMDRLHELIERTFGAGDRQLARLEREAADGREEPSPTAVEALASALRAEAAEDSDFAERLKKAVEDVRAAQPRKESEEQPGRTIHQVAKASGRGRTYQSGGDMTIHESHERGARRGQ